MQFELKSISVQSIPEALAKVERYRLLNEPSLAESICQDILTIVPDHQQALISMLLARTEQFGNETATEQAAQTAIRLRCHHRKRAMQGYSLAKLRLKRLQPLCSSKRS